LNGLPKSGTIKEGSRKYLQSNKKKVDKRKQQQQNSNNHRPSLEQFSNAISNGPNNLSALGRTTTIQRGKLNEMLSMAVSTTGYPGAT
jgi:hypothetical protein